MLLWPIGEHHQCRQKSKYRDIPVSVILRTLCYDVASGYLDGVQRGRKSVGISLFGWDKYASVHHATTPMD